jgi:hypothetical protein
MKTVVSALVATSLAATLAACTPAPKASEPAAGEAAGQASDGPVKGMPETDTCDAQRYVRLIGRPSDMPGMPEASGKLRYIHPDTPVTMDYREDRLNMVIGADGRVTELKCG